MTAVRRSLILLHMLLKLLLLHESYIPLPLLHGLGIRHVVVAVAVDVTAGAAVATVTDVMGIDVGVVEVWDSDGRIGDRMGIAYRRRARRRHRLRRHHVAVAGAISSVTHAVIAVVSIGVAALLSSRFFLLDESHHVIRQKEITVIVAGIRSVFSIHKCVHEGVVPAGTSRSHSLHLQHELLRRHVHRSLTSNVSVTLTEVVAIAKTAIVVVTRFRVRVGPVARRNRCFLLRDHQGVVVVAVTVVIAVRG